MANRGEELVEKIGTVSFEYAIHRNMERFGRTVWSQRRPRQDAEVDAIVRSIERNEQKKQAAPRK